MNCGMTEHSAFQCENVGVEEDMAYRLWAKPSPTPIQPVIMRAIEREQRPELTNKSFFDEIDDNPPYRQLTLQQLEEWQVKGDTSTYHADSPIPVKVNVDKINMRFEATVITDAFPPGLCLGPQELRCYNIDKQDPLEMRESTSAGRSW